MTFGKTKLATTKNGTHGMEWSATRCTASLMYDIQTASVDEFVFIYLVYFYLFHNSSYMQMTHIMTSKNFGT